jgi:hypothetical protein
LAPGAFARYSFGVALQRNKKYITNIDRGAKIQSFLPQDQLHNFKLQTLLRENVCNPSAYMFNRMNKPMVARR